MIKLTIKYQKKAKSKKGALDKNLAYKNELARLSFRTEELDHFYKTRKWIEKGLNYFKYNCFVSAKFGPHMIFLKR